MAGLELALGDVQDEVRLFELRPLPEGAYIVVL